VCGWLRLWLDFRQPHGLRLLSCSKLKPERKSEAEPVKRILTGSALWLLCALALLRRVLRLLFRLLCLVSRQAEKYICA
jgi:hypothetical protein